jgi:hypothetical protein
MTFENQEENGERKALSGMAEIDAPSSLDWSCELYATGDPWMPVSLTHQSKILKSDSEREAMFLRAVHACLSRPSRY